MADASIAVSEGDDLFRVAAQVYGDAAAWTILASANGLTDPVIAADTNLVVPDYTTIRANDGILAPT